MNAVVSFEAVGKQYAAVHALRDVNLQIKAGEIIGLLGHNGAGKTTSMKLVLGVIEASAGEVRLFGASPLGRSGRRLRASVGYLPENVRFYEAMNGREVLTYFADLKGVARRQCGELLEQVGLAHAAERRVRTYSKGMCQRLGLAQALLGRPRLLLLDEPTVGLDPIATRDFYAGLDALRKEGTTVLLSSHVLPGIERHIDRAAILGGGKLLAEGAVQELARRAQLPVQFRVRGCIGVPGGRERLETDGARFTQINGAHFEFSAPASRKLEFMRALLADPQVLDVQIEEPTLEALYAWYNREQQVRQEKRS